ncbi:MAG: hypothetical protein I8H91_02855, partial [Burkholderiales bacterium]|nr:hypothetical protein [Burkholderiales bacterium]
YTYSAAMARSGFQSSCGRIEYRKFGEALQPFFERVARMGEFSGLDASTSNLSATFARMTKTTGAYPCGHPLKHLIIIDTLFGHWENFWTAYQSMTMNEPEPGRDEMPVLATPTNADRQTSQLNDERKAYFKTLLATPGISLKSAAVSSGITVGTALAWAADSGFSVRRRPKILKPALREALISQLRLGAEKVAAAKLAQVSVETVTRLLLTEPGLHSWWKEARSGRAQSDARSAWTKTIQTLPYLSSVEWRKLEPAAYAWLYRNDRAWLQQSIQARPYPPIKPPPRIRWGQRDTALARSIRITASTWCQSHPDKRLTIGIVCGLVPTLKARLSKLNMLPLTRKALTEISGRKLRSTDTKALLTDAFE